MALGADVDRHAIKAFCEKWRIAEYITFQPTKKQ